jgi:hypothetical protein
VREKRCQGNREKLTSARVVFDDLGRVLSVEEIKQFRRDQSVRTFNMAK